ncbi:MULTISPECIES: hypothetical protein [pseudomallei group]|uniref:Uncharacterized protein n=1 Tax=Burkholderia mallei TaxID=13373 RepID=A0AAX1XAS0_BURML|nr:MULTISPECIES: hypothetical protein [pseudomallei group]PPF06420.1 hypothetical protein B9D88_015670 [Burkholderia pseudomallei]QGT06701.1 hypothetical protein D286_20360 [Burkholderia pseudomallei]RPA20178.1 hypothetical protein EGT61_000330 [Burkholderia mallei]RPA28458.1 hypothetical protein EGT70_01605 [Burkholderia mallei]RPA47242.1 hypothetical protein EGT65_03665 [Burkholderia mallei]
MVSLGRAHGIASSGARRRTQRDARCPPPDPESRFDCMIAPQTQTQTQTQTPTHMHMHMHMHMRAHRRRGRAPRPVSNGGERHVDSPRDA